MKKLALLLLTTMAVPSMAFAATDGVLGTTSRGTVNISVVAQAPTVPMAQITGLEDFDFGNIANDAPTPPSQTISNICVYMNTQGTYSMELYGEVLQHSFRGSVVPYTATYSDPISGVSFEYVSGPVSTAPILSQSGFAGSGTVGCNLSDLASLEIRLHSIPRPSAGESDIPYTGVLRMTVSPD